MSHISRAAALLSQSGAVSPRSQPGPADVALSTPTGPGSGGLGSDYATATGTVYHWADYAYRAPR